MKKKILIVLIVAVIVVLGFIFVQNKTVAPVSEVRIDTVPSEGSKKESQPAANKTNDDKKIMQLEIKTTEEGTGAKVVETGDTVGVYYTGKLTDGTVFDSNVGKGQPFEFIVGEGMVIQGWEQGFLGAKVGEKRTLTIPSDLGYGSRGAGGVIPPNATLIFDVEVASIK